MSVCSALILMESEAGCLFSWGLGCGRLHYRVFVMLTCGSVLSSPLGFISFVCAPLSAGLSTLHSRGRLGGVVSLRQASSLVCSVGSLWLAAPQPVWVPLIHVPSCTARPTRHTSRVSSASLSCGLGVRLRFRARAFLRRRPVLRISVGLNGVCPILS